MRKFKIGDEVRIVNTDNMGKEYEATRGQVGVIVREPHKSWEVQKYAVLFDTLKNRNSSFDAFYFLDSQFELVTKAEAENEDESVEVEEDDTYFKVEFEERRNKKGVMTRYMKTLAVSPCGVGYTYREAINSNIRMGAIVAAAKIVARKSEETWLMYNIAINSWGTDWSTGILLSLADRGMCGKFKQAFDKLKRKLNEAERMSRTCPRCGKVYATIEEMNRCVEWHNENKIKREKKYQDYLIRKEAKRRLSEAKRENKIAEVMKSLYEQENKEQE